MILVSIYIFDNNFYFFGLSFKMNYKIFIKKKNASFFLAYILNISLLWSFVGHAALISDSQLEVDIYNQYQSFLSSSPPVLNSSICTAVTVFP